MPFPASAVWSNFACLQSYKAGSLQRYRSDLNRSPLDVPLVKVALVNNTSALIIQSMSVFLIGLGTPEG